MLIITFSGVGSLLGVVGRHLYIYIMALVTVEKHKLRDEGEERRPTQKSFLAEKNHRRIFHV
jgi:hypothetical protein